MYMYTGPEARGGHGRLPAPLKQRHVRALLLPGTYYFFVYLYYMYCYDYYVY